MNEMLAAVLLASGAGLATGIGSIAALFLRAQNKKLLAFLLGFSGGVMLFGALTEILAKARTRLCETMSERDAFLFSLCAFFAGIALLALLERLLPEENSLKKGALLIGISLALHNFPEGLSTFLAALVEPSIAYPMVIAIALHNIPEGIAVAVPLLESGASKKSAFFWSFSSGLAEPLGALFGAFVLLPLLNGVWMGVLFAFAAGMMAYLSAVELLPRAVSLAAPQGKIGIFCGMAVMGTSLYLFL